MNKKLHYLIEVFDFHLGRGLSPGIAWSLALVDYFHVYHVDDGRPEIARSAGRVLFHLGLDDKEV